MIEQESAATGVLDMAFLPLVTQSREFYTVVIFVAIGVHAAVYREIGPVFWIVSLLGLVVGWNCRRRVTPPSYAANLPGMPDGPMKPPRVPGVVAQRAAQIGLLLTALSLAAPVPGPVVLALVLITFASWASSMITAIRRVRHMRRLVRALKDHAPVIGIPFGGYGGGPLQIAMWEPYLAASGLPGVIFNWREAYFDRILHGAEPAWPLVQVGEDKEVDLDWLLPRSLRALFYVHNAKENGYYIGRSSIKHVWLGHGDSDKPASYLKRQSKYTRLVVAGQAAIDRYTDHGVKVRSKKFVVLGRPQTWQILSATAPIAEMVHRTVLYAPTWQGKNTNVDFSSLVSAPSLVRALIEHDLRIIFRPHPLSYSLPETRLLIERTQEILAADPHGEHVWGPQADTEWGVVDCMNASDVMISDVSSVVSDFLQSQKPYAMISMRASVEDFRAEFPIARSAYVILGDLSNLDEVLEDMLGGDCLQETRTARRRYVLSDFQGRESSEAFATFVREIAS